MFTGFMNKFIPFLIVTIITFPAYSYIDMTTDLIINSYERKKEISKEDVSKIKEIINGIETQITNIDEQISNLKNSIIKKEDIHLEEENILEQYKTELLSLEKDRIDSYKEYIQISMDNLILLEGLKKEYNGIYSPFIEKYFKIKNGDKDILGDNITIDYDNDDSFFIKISQKMPSSVSQMTAATVDMQLSSEFTEIKKFYDAFTDELLGKPAYSSLKEIVWEKDGYSIRKEMYEENIIYGNNVVNLTQRSYIIKITKENIQKEKINSIKENLLTSNNKLLEAKEKKEICDNSIKEKKENIETIKVNIDKKKESQIFLNDISESKIKSLNYEKSTLLDKKNSLIKITNRVENIDKFNKAQYKTGLFAFGIVSCITSLSLFAGGFIGLGLSVWYSINYPPLNTTYLIVSIVCVAVGTYTIPLFPILFGINEKLVKSKYGVFLNISNKELSLSVRI